MSQEPWIYTPEQLKEEARLFKEWMDKPESIFFKQFAVERGYPAQRMSEFAEESPEFALVYHQAKEWQEAKIATKAFWGNGVNSKIAQLMLNVHHNWIEKQTISSLDPESREIVKQMLKEMGRELSQKTDDDSKS